MSTASPATEEILDEEEGVVLSPEEEDELVEAIARAEEDFRAGRCISAEQFCAERGIPWKPSSTG